MLEGAERTAISEHVTKEEQDFWVLESHHRAAKAAQEGLLSDIQVSVAGSCKDEGIRASMSQKLMDHLPYLLPGGCAINAANACLMHDGAAFVALCSEEYGKRHNLIPAAVLAVLVAAGFLVTGRYGWCPVAAAAGYGLALRRGYRSLEGMNGDISGYALTVGEVCGVVVAACLGGMT